LEMFSCATCHTRVMPDGSVVKGAQGNFALGRPNAMRLRESARRGEASAFWQQLKLTLRATTAVPWLTPDPELRIMEGTASPAITASCPAIRRASSKSPIHQHGP